MAVAVNLAAKAPAECTEAEIDDFIAFVRAGEEVTGSGLEARVRRAFRLGFLRDGNCLVSIAALKCPVDTYRTKVERSSGIELPAASYPYEFGWVFTLPSARGHGYAPGISKYVLATANDRTVFATSRTDNTGMHRILKGLGFSPAGSTYPSDEGPHKIQLFVYGPVHDDAF